MPRRRPPKVEDLLEKVRRAIDAGRYRDVVHASQRQEERAITRPEYLHVLRTGYHEKRKDKFDEQYTSWNYAIRGRTVDGRDLRVIVSFETALADDLLIITVIEVSYG